MKIYHKIAIVLLFSCLITFSILMFFQPILSAKSLMFPYAIHPFDIINEYPKPWFYLKITYCLSLFITVTLLLNSLSTFLKFNKKPKVEHSLNTQIDTNKNHLNLLIGTNADTQEKIFISEQGLYQNLLVTGTIGSREN